MLKKVLSLALAVVLACSVITPSFSKDDPKAELEYKQDVLKALGIVNIDSDNEYALFRDLSKNSFINFVCNLYGDYGYTAEYSEAAIAFAEGMGLIHSGQDDLYKPLPFDEALTILVRVMGYGMHAEENGGFPMGYTTIAARLGLTDGLDPSNGRAMQEHDAVTLLYNVINCAYVDIQGFTEEGIVYGGTSDKTVLYELRKIYRVKGVMKSSGSSVLTSDISRNPGMVTIDDYDYKTNNDYTDCLGMYVEAYVKETMDYDEVIYLTQIDNKELTIQASDIIGISDDFKTFEYFSADNKKKVSLSPVAAVIYNGQPLDTYTTDDFKPAEGSIRFIENNNSNSGYDVVFITEYKTVIVESMSKLDETVKNLYTNDENNLSIDLYNNGEDDIKIYNGEDEIAFRDIALESVLTVKESYANGRHVIVVYASDNKIGGTIMQFKQNEDIVISVDGVEYTLSEAYEKALADKDPRATEIKIGQSYNFYLDSMGEIAYAKSMTGVQRYGIVMNTTTEGAFGNEYFIRIFTTEGEWKTIKFAEKIDFDGKKQQMTQSILDQIETAHNGKISVVAYKTNSDGNIVSLELPKAYDGLDDDTFNYKMNMTNIYRPNNTSFQSQMFIESGATMWFVKVSESSDDPPERRLELMRDEESYSARSTGALAQDKTYTFHAFNIDRFNFADLFIIEETNQLALDSMAEGNLFVVNEVSESISSAGDILGVVSGMMGSYDAVSYYCKEPEMVMGFKKGDVITLHTDSEGYIDKVQKVYDVSMGVDYYCPTESEIHSINTKLNGIVKLHNVSENKMKVDCGTGEWNMRTASNNLVCVYDSVTDTLKRGSIADIEPGDFIVTRLNRSRIYTIVVYK